MYRTHCVLAFLAMSVVLAHSFSWDIVLARANRLEFYNEGKVTHSASPTNNTIHWMTYDPLHKRILFTETLSIQYIFSFDIETGKTETLLKLRYLWNHATYDPATELLFVDVERYKYIIYSFPAKPGTDGTVNAVGTPLVYLEDAISSLAVDSCRGYIYWISVSTEIHRALLNGTDSKLIIESSHNNIIRTALTIDPQTQIMYWIEEKKDVEFSVVSADTNGNNRRTLYSGEIKKDKSYTLGPTQVSKDSIYWANIMDNHFWQLPKIPYGTDIKPEQIEISDWGYQYMVSNYTIEEQSRGNPFCQALKSLLPNYSATNDSGSLNDTIDVSLLRVNETKVSAGSPGSCEKCNVSICHNYCLQGDCSTSADGQPKCRCHAGYAGERCEVNVCHAYCLNDGECLLNEDKPVCQCTRGYEGDRCQIPISLKKCSQTVSMLKDLLGTDFTLDTDGKGVKSTCLTPTTVV